MDEKKHESKSSKSVSEKIARLVEIGEEQQRINRKKRKEAS